MSMATQEFIINKAIYVAEPARKSTGSYYWFTRKLIIYKSSARKFTIINIAEQASATKFID
jgi:hypothetical protein